MADLLPAALRSFVDRVLNRPVANQELAVSEDSMFRRWQLFPYSPDKLIQRKGFAIFEEMVKDDQIAQCLAARKTLLLAPGWEVKPADDSDEAARQAEFVRWNLEEAIEGSFHDDIWEIAGALEIGWSLSEKVFDVVADGEWAGLWKLKYIKSKNPRDYNLDRDDHDNLKPDGIVRITQPQVGQRFPADKFIVYSYRKRYEDLFGTAVLRSLYDLWWIKHVLKRAMGVHFERAGVPVATAKYPAGMSEVEQNKLFQLVKSIRFESAAVIPKEVELAFTEARSKAGEAFIEAIKHIDEQIVKTVLGQTLTQSQGERGSQSLGRVHKDIMVMYAEELAHDIEVKVIRDQIVKCLIDYNFPDPLYPKLCFKPVAPEDDTQRVDAFLKAAEKGAVIPTEKDEAEIRKCLGFEEREPGDKPLAKPQAPEQPGQPPKPGQEQRPPEREPEELAERKGPASRVDFVEALSVIEDVGVDDLMADLAPMLGEAVLDLAAQVERKRIVEDKDTKAIEALALKGMAEMRAAIRDSLVRVARRGRKSAVAELSAARKQLNLADPQDVSRFLPKEVEKYFVDRSFTITGILRDQVMGLAKNSLYSSVKNGQDLREAIAGLKAVLDPYIKQGSVDPEASGGARLETAVRTNVVDAFNMSRLETYKENGDFVKGLMYSAVLDDDDRTREDHAAMDGRQYAIDDPIWDKWTPPNGFNCRCVLIPVTLADGDFKPSRQPPASVQPDPGFKANGA